ncbi:hypothetical protein Tco_1069989 [Tanacetum coccineum]|uniref:Uncharacterized protein n=1 Tax=Tanacetum coccineum TaxID=301880 RepID=A0ABQ5HM03_9ASTR
MRSSSSSSSRSKIQVRRLRMKPRRAQAVAMTIQYGVRGMILAVQSEASSKITSPVLWVEIGDSSLTGLELVQETIDKVMLAKLLAVRYLVKVSWNSKGNFELTWVWEDYLKDKFDNQSIERDRLIGIGFVLDFVEFISFTFSDKEMILVIEAVSR